MFRSLRVERGSKVQSHIKSATVTIHKRDQTAKQYPSTHLSRYHQFDQISLTTKMNIFFERSIL